jgi:hypothetical protein
MRSFTFTKDINMRDLVSSIISNQTDPSNPPFFSRACNFVPLENFLVKDPEKFR